MVVVEEMLHDNNTFFIEMIDPQVGRMRKILVDEGMN